MASIFLVLILWGYKKGFFMHENEKIIKIGYPAYWGELMPALQHTVYADSLLANEFETLVGVGDGGTITPKAAKSWKISDDFITYTFKIDQSRIFSNGEYLSAEHFKDAWEYGLKLAPKSSNSSLRDVLYLTKDFFKFEKNGKLPGVKVIDPGTLEVTFQSSFRTALFHFSGGRLAAFLFNKENNEYYGTGPYHLVKNTENYAEYVKNKFWKKNILFDKVEVLLIEDFNAKESLANKKVDVLFFTNKFNLDYNEPNISFLSDLESSHKILVLNGNSNRIFSSKNIRKAINYIFSKEISLEKLPLKDHKTLRIDPQVYLPLQQGRMNDDEVKEIIESGKQYIADLQKMTAREPIKIFTLDDITWLKNILNQYNVKYVDISKGKTWKELIYDYYNKHDADLITLNSSVGSGDPDVLYHMLSENGAIFSPILYRKKVSDLLEEGRSIIDINKIDSHYKNVSRAILEDVPFVHVGYIRELVAFNDKEVQVKKSFKQREDHDFVIFEPR